MKKLIIGQMINYYLEKNNMTRKELGVLLGKSESAVSKWINGVSTPLAKDLAEMTYIFKVDIETLMYGGNQNKSSSKKDYSKKKIFEKLEIMPPLSEEQVKQVIDFLDFISSR